MSNDNYTVNGLREAGVRTMSDNIDKPQGGETDKSHGDTTGPTHGAGETQLSPDLILKIAELERDNKKYRDERKAQEATLKKQQEQQLVDQEKYKELAEGYRVELDKLKPIAEQHATIEAAFNASLDNRLKLIPDDVRKELVDPVRKGMNPVAFSDWLDRNGPRLQARQAPPLDGGAGGTRTTSGGANSLTAEDLEMARAMNIKPDVWAKNKAEIAAIKAAPRKE